MLHLTPIYTSDYLLIEADARAGFVRAEWLRAASDQEFKAGAIRLHEVLAGSRYDRVLTNAQKITALSTDTKEWMAGTFYNLISGTSTKKMARVMPANLFHQIGLESMTTRAEARSQLSYQVKSFADEAKAAAWLMV